jgi:hypothetical protein
VRSWQDEECLDGNVEVVSAERSRMRDAGASVGVGFAAVEISGEAFAFLGVSGSRAVWRRAFFIR